MFSNRLRLIVSIMVLIGLGSASARGATLSWNNAAGGAAATAGNWAPVQVPTGADDLAFNLNAIYTVTYSAAVGASRTHTYHDGTVTLLLSAPHAASTGITVGDIAGDVATMTLTTGMLTSNGSMIVGKNGTGTLNVNDGDADLIIAGAASDLTVGLNGDAAMSITNVGHVQVADQFIAGSNSTSSPTITVSGFSIAPIGISFLEVLGTSQSRIGGGGDATMTVSNGALADFAGDLVIANGSASVSSVTVQTAGLLNARLNVDGDLLIGRNTTASDAGNGTLNINTGGTTTVGGNTSLGDPNGPIGIGTIVLNGGTFNGTLPVNMESGSAITGTGTINADVNVGLGSIVATTATGLTCNGIVNCTTAGVFGTKIHFGATGGYLGSGTCDADITGDVGSTITATGPLTIGNNTISGFFYLGTLAVGTQNVTLVDSNGPVLGGLTTMSSGGQLSGTSPVGLQNGGRVQGEGTIVGNVTAAGVLDPQRNPTPGGIMNITGNLLMNPSGEYDMEIGGTPGSNQHDRLNVSGTATFDGTLRVSIPNGYVPKVGEQFIAINAAAGRTGTFANIIPPSPSPCNNVTFVMVYSSTAAIVLVRPPLGCTALGDLNSNGSCEGTDIKLFLAPILGGFYNACSDMNGDCVNDENDVPIFVNCLL